MKKEDFVFKSQNHDIVNKHDDFWFKIIGSSKEFLTNKLMEQSMIEVTECVYSLDEDIVGIKRLFPWNYDVVLYEDNNLKEMLRELALEIIIKEDE